LGKNVHFAGADLRGQALWQLSKVESVDFLDNPIKSSNGIFK